MNEIKELTLEILKHTQISDVEMAEETAEIIINTLGYHKKTEKVSSEAKPVNCAECKFLEVINQNDCYAICVKSGLKFLPFQLDTRTHTCQFAELKEAPMFKEVTNDRNTLN